MTIEFYKHCDMPDDMNEKRAFFRVARLLDQLFRTSDDHYVLIANVDPQRDDQLPHLPQLDAVLLSTHLVANLEFKNYYDPIVGRGPSGQWYTRKNEKKDQIVKGGASANPYQQAQYAKRQWVDYLEKQTQLPVKWKFMQHFVMFHPYLHSQSRISVRGVDHYWLHFDSVDKIGELVSTSQFKNAILTAKQVQELARNVWRAERWFDVDRILNRNVGYLHIQVPGQVELREPLYSFSEVTIGRTRGEGHHIEIPYKLVSSQQARLEILGEAVRLFDVGSKNGTYLNGQRLDNEAGALLHQGDIVFLGGQGEKAVQIRFEPAQSVSPDDYTFTATS